MDYQYWGYLKAVLDAPDPNLRDSLDHVLFEGSDLAEWTTKDLAATPEWQKIPVHRNATKDGVRLTGQFEDVRRLEVLRGDDPSFWVPLSSLETHDARFPIDLSRYPVIEITYRCLSEDARLAWAWTYPGGLYADELPRTRRWQTLACLVAHRGFPSRLDAVILRLYSTTRTTESVEVGSLRFRAMSAEETAACERLRIQMEATSRPKHYPVLDEFFPLGVWMNAEVARRLAEMLGISLVEYWDLAFEDIVLHNHNCIGLEGVEQLNRDDWRDLLNAAGSYALKIAVTHRFLPGESREQRRALVESRVKPFADRPEILAWGLAPEVSETHFVETIETKTLIEQSDPNHPVFFETRHPSAFALFAPYFPISSMNHYMSHCPWEMGDLVRTHLPLAGGQQFWVNGPAFVYGTGTPEWNTCPELRLMLNLSIANGARGWLSYAYHSDPIWVIGSFERSLTGPFLAFSDLWQELGQWMGRWNALAPLLLQAKPGDLPPKWYVASASSSDRPRLSEGVGPTGSYRLQGADFSLYFVINNDMRGMSSLNFRIPEADLRGAQIFDVSDFVHDRKWAPMVLDRHLEMFPGQGAIVLVAKPEVCAHWGDVLAERLMELDRRQLAAQLGLARTYKLNVEFAEKLVEARGTGDALRDLEALDRARNRLVDLLYECRTISDVRTRIHEACAAVCGCDGALCRLINRGKYDLAKEWGEKVVSLAREFTTLRVELRHGQGATLLPHCEDLVDRARRLLSEIRALA